MVGGSGLVAKSRPTLVTPTLVSVARQAPLFMGFPRQGYWSGLPSPLSGDIPNLGIELASLALTGRFFTTAPLGKHIESG